jgi:hypothetical protein
MNSRRHQVRKGVRGICAAMLLCAAAGVPAEPVYKQLDAAGRITISTRPDPTFLPPTAVVPAQDVVSALASATPMSTRHAAIVDANEATRRLAQAKREQQQGVEPLPGEEAHITDENGVNPKYQRRQDKLRRTVEQAQRRSSQADRKLHARVKVTR